VSEQIKASLHRLEDAEALFAAERWRGAMYVAGYALECVLKAKLMQRFQCRTLERLEERLHQRRLIRKSRSVFTHEIELLFQLSGVVDRLKDNTAMYAHLKFVNRWTPAWRYSVEPTRRDDAEDFLTAVRELRSWVASNV
jgi:HEPN domain-containing protein